MTSNGEKLPLPLEGIRVLDLTHIVAGPFCSMIFADMGAEVIKVERPGAGDRSRINTPFKDGPNGQKVSVRYLGVNRNKKSVTLDLRDPRCKSAFEKMVKESDILLDNWGPGALRRLGLGYEVLSQMNPGLIYASITGYGDTEDMQGPYSQWPANNPCVQGMGGWMEITGAPGGAPQMVGDNIGDTVPGVWSALGVMLALEARHKTGKGQHVDMAMYDCMVAHTTSSMPLYQLTGQSSSRARENMFSAQLALKTNDGYAVLAGAGDEDKWVALWQLLGREDLIQDPQYLGKGISGEFYFENIVPAIEEWSQHLSKREVAEQLIEIGYSMGMVQNTADLDQCPHLEARKMFVDCGDTLGGSFRTANTPINLTACPDTPTGPPPLLGQHNRDILCSIGGLTEEQLLGMETDRVV
ncbi:MAG TPA: CoA transferase [Dehalococcoidia bacterium]|jgi:crotonobetainyl-CoA:carnitine CoA-transferase CaiB-like acyl-CoA transferase|nr:CaiB/BaiF CoA-transferase family protein [Chloroflexota bacterium]HIB11256.1 CoA transferase [Dehalococcoidia bacterium]|tara:strand:+ start:1830 stop:3065 length:1236 start_codon:yes stop_codon:yes gene_type:complete